MRFRGATSATRFFSFVSKAASKVGGVGHVLTNWHSMRMASVILRPTLMSATSQRELTLFKNHLLELASSRVSLIEWVFLGCGQRINLPIFDLAGDTESPPILFGGHGIGPEACTAHSFSWRVEGTCTTATDTAIFQLKFCPLICLYHPLLKFCKWSSNFAAHTS